MTNEPAHWIDVEQRVDAAIPFHGRIIAKPLDRHISHAGHDPHAEHDVNRIGDFKADFG